MAKSPPEVDLTAEQVKKDNLRFLRGLQEKALRKLGNSALGKSRQQDQG